MGSLPHAAADDAVADLLDWVPALPHAPQLPAADRREGMLAQAASGMRGVDIAPDGALVAERRPAAVDTVDPEVALDGPAFASLHAFLAAVGRRRDPVKLQLTGPLTLGTALAAAGIPSPVAFTMAGAQVRTQARALVEAARAAAPEAPLLVVLDEPWAVALTEHGFPLPVEGALDLLSGALATLGAGVLTGVHCCGRADWRLLLQAGADLVSFPAEHAPVGDPGPLAAHLDRGGYIAWGAVPTDRPIGTSVDTHWRRLSELWCDLARGGCDPALLRRQALLTPACGLSGHSVEQARRIYALVRDLGERVQDQALATRLSAGA